MKKLFFFIILVSFSINSYSKTEKLKVLKADDFDDYAILAVNRNELWWIELGVGCSGLEDYEGKYIFGEYGIDLDSPGAKVFLPSDGENCRISDAEELSF